MEFTRKGFIPKILSRYKNRMKRLRLSKGTEDNLQNSGIIILFENIMIFSPWEYI